MAVLKVQGLTKQYQQHFWSPVTQVLRGVDLTVQEGEIFGFLGVNGAGKTTVIRCLLRLILPDSGTVQIFGRDHRETAVRAQVGYLPELPRFYDHLTGRELLHLTARLSDLPARERAPRVEEALHRVGMQAKADRALRQCSKGMVQRLGLAQAILHRPRLLILDEPMSGLDPIGRREVRDLLLALREEGATIFFSSHILSDAEAICDRVGLLTDGRISLLEAVDALLQEKTTGLEVACTGLDPATLPPPAVLHKAQADIAYVTLEDPQGLFPLLHAIEHGGGRVLAVTPRRPTLEGVILDRIKQAAAGEPDP